MQNHSDLWPLSELPPKAIVIYEGPEVFLNTYAAVSMQHQVSFAAFWLQAEVLNGGLVQFFSNSTGVLAPEAVAACRKVGLLQLASKVEQAMAWFGTAYPRDREVRESALEEYADAHPEDDGPFAELEDEVVALIYDEGPGIEQSTRMYLEAHGS